MRTSIPCLLFEDEDLIVVNKPAGIATHRAAEDAPWGIVEFLQNHRPALPPLGIHQRLDRETSGVMLFAKTPEANRSFASQFEKRTVRKTYVFVTKGTLSCSIFTATEPIDDKKAKTEFLFLRKLSYEFHLWEARPETGRTHQVRLHAAAHGLSIVGDLKKKDEQIEPLLLHAARLEIFHPKDGRPLVFEAPLPSYFECAEVHRRRWEAAWTLRRALIDEKETNAYRWIHRESDGFPNLTVDCLDQWLYVEDFGNHQNLDEIRNSGQNIKGMILSYAQQGKRKEDKRLLWGSPPPPDFTILENGIRYHLDPLAPGGIGLFLDQRENRKFIHHLAHGKRVLNLFAYTCGFSVSAAAGGARETVNIDLSRKALDGGQKNFTANGLDPNQHQFLARDVKESLRQLISRKERFDVVMIDPPSFSRSKSSGSFSVKHDFENLISKTMSLLTEGGWLFASSNLADWGNAAFLSTVQKGIQKSSRKITKKIWMPQPFDFPATPLCAPYLKSVWITIQS